MGLRLARKLMVGYLYGRFLGISGSWCVWGCLGMVVGEIWGLKLQEVYIMGLWLSGVVIWVIQIERLY